MGESNTLVNVTKYWSIRQNHVTLTEVHNFYSLVGAVFEKPRKSQQTFDIKHNY